jgi:hypothetical protein
VCACHLAPDDSEFAASDLLLSAVDIGDLLTKVEVCCLSGADAYVDSVSDVQGMPSYAIGLKCVVPTF